MAASISEVIFKIIADATGLKKETREAEKQLRSLSDVNFNSLQRRINQLKMALRSGWDVEGIDNLKRELNSLEKEFEQTGRVSGHTLKSIRQELNSTSLSMVAFATTSHRSLKQVEAAIRDLDRELSRLDAGLKFAEVQAAVSALKEELRDGWSDNGTKELTNLQRSLNDVQKEFEQTGHVSITSLGSMREEVNESTATLSTFSQSGSMSLKTVEKSVQDLEQELTELAAESVVEMGIVETTIHGVNDELQGMDNPNALSGANDSIQKTDNSLEHLQESILQARSAFQKLDQSTKVTDDKGRFYSLSFKRLEGALVNVQNEFRETGEVGEEAFQTFNREVVKARVALSQLGDADGVAQLAAAIDEAEVHVRSFGRNSGLPEFRSEVTETTSAMDRLRGVVLDASIVGRALKMSLVGLVPALVPALATTTTSVMGLGASFLSAGAGVAGFAAVAAGNFMNLAQTMEDIEKAQKKVDSATDPKKKKEALEELNAIYATLSSEQRKAIDEIAEFKAFFFDFSKEFEKPIFSALFSSLDFLKSLLQNLKPAIGSAADGISTILDLLNKSLDTSSWQNFFNFVGKTAGPSLVAWGKAIGNLLTGIINLFIAFSPVAKDMENGLLGITQRFAQWSEGLKSSNGFQSFLDYSIRNGPNLISLLKNLNSTIVSTVVALAPIGEIMLAVLNHITSVIAKVLEGVAAFAQWQGFIPLLSGLTAAFITLKGAMTFTSIAPYILAMFNPMTRAVVLTQLWTKAQVLLNASILANPYVAIAALIIGIGVALYTAYQRSETFRNGVNSAIQAVNDVIQKAVNFIKNITSSMWDKAMISTAGFRAMIAKEMSELGQLIAQGFQSAISIASTFFVNIGSSIASLFGQGLQNSVGSIVSGFIAQLKVGFSSLGGVMSLIAPALTGIILSLMGISGPIGIIIGGIVSLIGFLYRLSKTNEDVRNAFNSAWQGILSAFSAVISALQPIIQVFKDSFAQMAAELGPQFQQTFQVISQSLQQLKPAFSELGSTFGQLLTTIIQLLSQLAIQMQPVISQLAGSFVSLIPVIFPIIQQFISLWIQLQRTLISSVVNIAATILPILAQAVMEIFPAILQVVQAVLPVILTLLQSLIPIVLQLALSIIPLILQAVQAVFPIVLQIIQSVLPIIVLLIGSVVTIISTLAKTIIPLILSAVTAVFPAVLAIIQGIVPLVTALLKIIVQVITGVLIPAIKYILSIVQIVFPAIITVIQNAVTIITNVIKLWIAVFKGDWSGVWNAAKTILTTIWNSIVTLLRAALSVITTSMSAAWSAVKNVTSTVFNWVWSYLKSIFGFIVNVVSTGANRALQAVKTAWNAVESHTSNIFNAIWSFLRSIFSSIFSVVSTGANRALQAVKTAWNAAKSHTSNIFNAIWNFLRSIFGSIYSTVSSRVTSIWQNIANGWNTAKNKTIEIFNSIKQKVSSTFTDIVNGAKQLPGRIGSGIKAMAGSVRSGVSSLANTLASSLGKGLNGAIDGVNWVLGKIGVKSEIKKWPIPHYATGTGNKPHPGGPAIVGDGKEEEYIIDGDGTHMISPATDTLVNLKPGARVFSGKQTKQLIKSGIAAYKKGNAADLIKGAAKSTIKSAKNVAGAAKGKVMDAVKAVKDKATSVGSKAKDMAFDVFEYMSKPAELMKKVFSKYIPTLPKINGAFGDILTGSVKKVKDQAVSYVKDKLNSFGGDGAGFGNGAAFKGSGAAMARAAITQALQMLGKPMSLLNPLMTIAQRESGFNPNAINLWDINARRGDPSIGLFQIIGSTFKRWMYPGHGNRRNPLDSALAAIRYMDGRYGGVMGHPGIKSMMRGGGYKPYKNGTGNRGHKGGNAILGDGGKAEPFLLPDGRLGLSPAIATLFPNLPKGTIVWKSIQDFLNDQVPEIATNMLAQTSGMLNVFEPLQKEIAQHITGDSVTTPLPVSVGSSPIPQLLGAGVSTGHTDESKPLEIHLYHTTELDGKAVAKGTYKYTTEYQERDKRRTKRFKEKSN